MTCIRILYGPALRISEWSHQRTLSECFLAESFMGVAREELLPLPESDDGLSLRTLPYNRRATLHQEEVAAITRYSV